jgi:hypothetical protein
MGAYYLTTAAPVAMLSFTRLLPWLLALLGSTSAVLAFPASPDYTLYGIVRDEMGQTFASENADIVLKYNGVEIARSIVSPLVFGDRNYELRVCMDAGRTIKAYDARALFAGDQFTVEVIVDGVTHLPIETSVYTPATTSRGLPTIISVPLTVGAPGDRVQRDFTVGVDSNNDGLPDAWQQAMLSNNNLIPDGGDWNYGLVTRNGDLNHNGISNYQEYIAGTYDADPSQSFQLVLTSYTLGIAQFQFYTILNKTYNIEQSTDLKTWTPLSFAVTSTSERKPFYQASSTGIIQAFANPPAPPAGSGIFFRLTVR